MMTGLECGHLYCTACWTEYLTTKIMDEGASQMIECPGSCNIVVTDQTVMTLISDPRVKLKYQHLITNSFVQCNRLLRWCPSPDCSNAVKVQHVDSKPVKCRCGHLFCFQCSENWHDPVRCHLIKKWIKKCDDDSETSNWISANTKECPKCGATIEKDGGCNHMICKNQSCKVIKQIQCKARLTSLFRRTSVGCAWGHGSRTGHLGTTAIGQTDVSSVTLL